MEQYEIPGETLQQNQINTKMASLTNLLLIFAALPLLASAAGIHRSRSVGPQSVQNPEVNTKALERKINPEGIQSSCKANDSRGTGGLSGNARESSRWRNGYFVQLDPAWSKDEAALIESALYELSTVLCIPILMWGPNQVATGDYSYILRGGGACSSPIGKVGGRQVIKLDVPGCMYKGIIMHENIHALGFNHEQTRTDRDQYIDVFETEIEDAKRGNYKPYAGSLTFGVPYDFYSIMHYGSYDFSKYGRPTMLKKDGTKIVKQRDGLRDSDKQKLRAMYKCN